MMFAELRFWVLFFLSEFISYVKKQLEFLALRRGVVKAPKA